MPRYKKGEKVKTLTERNNGFGTIIPKGSVLTVLYDNDRIVNCKYNNQDALFEYDLIEKVVINTNADKIRNMTDEELADFINMIANDSIDTISKDGTKDYSEIWEDKDSTLEWLKKELD